MPAHGDPVIVYTDGACRGNPGPGGWAWAVPGGRYASGADPHTTNQRMEITAALEALQALTPEARAIEVVSDSTYVVKCFTDGWWRGWVRRNWKNSQNKPVANRDLWEPLIALARRLTPTSASDGSRGTRAITGTTGWTSWPPWRPIRAPARGASRVPTGLDAAV